MNWLIAACGCCTSRRPTLAADQQFLRRVFLDAIGVLPTADEARAFLQERGPDRRERLVESLLARPEFGEMWALRWSDVLRNEEKVLDSKGVELFHRWIRDSVAADKPIDRFVRELIRGSGSSYENPPANLWRAHRDPLTRAETVARLFPGARLQCAKCHNHPFDWPAEFTGFDRGIRAGQLPGVRRGRERDGSAGGDRFLRTFGKPERLLGCECERSNETSLNQAFVLLSSEEMHRRLTASGNRLDRWAQSDLSADQLIEELYCTALSRPPSPEERDAALRLFAADVDGADFDGANFDGADRVALRQSALQDLAWALLNANEFLFRW